MSASMLSLSDEEARNLAIVALLGVSAFFWAVGFSSGWQRGRTSLLISLERARRIQRHLNKEHE